MKFNHVGIPTVSPFDGEIPLPHLKVTVSDHLDNPFGIQWQRYWEGAPYPHLVKDPSWLRLVHTRRGASDGFECLSEVVDQRHRLHRPEILGQEVSFLSINSP
jgi:hypothetical protein